jgi:trimethylamine--corrinoid protein Co-methyltransferase
VTRRQRRRREQRGRIRQLPFVDLAATIGPLQALSLDQIEAIHHASLRVLSETGIEILSASARALFGDAGAEVDPATERVRMEPALVESLIRSCPAGWTFHARNAEHNVTLGGRSLNFCNATTPPYVSDLEGGRRIGSCVDFNDAVRLCQSLNILHFFYGYPVEPQDLPPETRHLDCYHAHATLSDKVWRAYALTLDRVTDAIEMARIARAVTREQMASEPSLMLNCNTNSPLKIDASMCDGAIAMARMGQPVVISAFTMAGAMAPVTMAGALVEQNAECLAGMALTQLARKGAPVVYGAFTSNVHMRSGAVSLGTPEYAQAALVGGQLARRYGVPYKSSNVNSSNAPDVQAVYESMMAIWSATLGGADIMAHGIGWLESGLTFSFE